MDLLHNTPYLLCPLAGPKVVAAATELAEQVELLRKRGTLRDDTLRRLRQEWGIRQVYESAGIEGNQLDLSETRMAIQKGITISGKPPEHSDEVRNLHTALEYLERLAGVQEPLTEREIREVHAIIVGAGDRERGAYRSIEVMISNSPHKPIAPILVPDEMSKYSTWLKQASYTLPIPLLAAVCHAWLVHIHPFRDGNGRTARAVMNLLLMRHGFPVVVIRRKDRQRYYEALRSSDDGDLAPFLELITDRCRDSITQIDRLRTAEEGISIALEKVRAADERAFGIWLDGMRLLSKSLADSFKRVEESELSFRSEHLQYDPPELDDYLKLGACNPDGATWLINLSLVRGGTRHAVLFWIGFSSEGFRTSLRKPSAFPSVWVSMENPNGPPKWKNADHTFPPTVREIAFLDGRYFARLHNNRLREYDSVVTLTSEFTRSVVEGWFAG